MKPLLRKKSATQPRRRPPVAGTSRPQSFSYRSSRYDQDFNVGRAQPRQQDSRRRERLIKELRQRFGLVIAGVVLLVCIGFMLHLSPTPKVEPLSASSNAYFLRSTSAYQQAARQLFASSLFNGNKITVNTAGIAAKLQQEFPELASVSISLPIMGHRPVVYIAPTTPSLLLQTTHGTYVLDDTGKALLKADAVGGIDKMNLPTIIDNSGLAVQLNHVALPADTINFIRTVAAELQAKGITPSKLVLPSAAYELDVTPQGAGYYIKFNLHSGDARQQAGTYLAVRHQLAAQHITPKHYIDVRLDGRAYYK